LTFTDYNESPSEDKFLFDIVKRLYSKVYFWPQAFSDVPYAKEICGEGITFIDPSLNALDDFLQSEKVDYIGTRLHGGIRALQHKRRTIIVAVDNRATEMGADFHLPVISRSKLSEELATRIMGAWPTEVIIDERATRTWKEQFQYERDEQSASALSEQRPTRLTPAGGPARGKTNLTTELKAIVRAILPLGVRRSIKWVLALHQWFRAWQAERMGTGHRASS
jgi:hypothetical protein